MADLGVEALQVEFRAGKVTLETLMNLFNRIVQGHYTPTHGEQSLRKMQLHNAELTTLDVDPIITHDLRRRLKQYGVDFHIDKRLDTAASADGQRHYVLWIKARDQKVIKQALERVVREKTVGDLTKDATARAKDRSAEQRQRHDPNRGDDPR